ncbi:MAG: hypothetical protein J5737_01640 [Bacteroidales bacterium]|nr:hypothetical protein [Bacteroidales bacterium]
MKAARRIPAIAAILLLCACSHPEQEGVQSMVSDLLSKIDSSGFYIARREARLAEKRSALAWIPSGSRELYDAYINLAEDYSKFISDSAIVYCDKAARAALDFGDEQLYYKALLLKAGRLFNTGYSVAGLSILDSIPRERLDQDNLVRYLNNLKGLYHSTYLDLASKPELRSQFVTLYEHYRDTVLSLIPPDSFLSLRENERICAREGDFEKALEYNGKRLSTLSPGSANRAGVLYDRYIIYHHYMGNPVGDHIELLLESSIYDVVTANQDIASLKYVEDYLKSIGAVENAKKISDYYYETIVRHGSRSRLLSVTSLSMDINDQYSSRLARQNREIKFGLLLIVLLSVMLTGILIQQLRSRNKILRLNKDLERSGKTANRYVLGFFQLYSSYITRLLALRAKINTNTRKGNTKYVLDLTDPSKDITNDELKQMYHNFDSAFLDIFPNFVQDFNSLLRPECRIELKPTELLNMDLRIFAIIKLGITDSAKISELLHCSIKTVYNKRSGINSKLLVPKDSFAEELAKL